MEKIIAILKSKKFWTLVSSIVAALAAYFAVACSTSYRTISHGLHLDTVKTELKIRTKNVN